MDEPRTPPNRDHEVPSRTGDDIGGPEPLIPDPNPVPHERRDLPEEETDEQIPHRGHAGASHIAMAARNSL
jgi:hypothetical protein